MPKKCKQCGRKIVGKLIPKDAPLVKEMIDVECPFFCKTCRRIIFPYRATKDIVYFWPIPFPETYGEQGLISRPEFTRDRTDEMLGRTDYAIVLSCGPGYYDNKRFNPNEVLAPGTLVLCDKLVPWMFDALTPYGKDELIVYCGFGDIKGVVEK